MLKEEMGNNATVYTREDGMRIVAVDKPGFSTAHLSIETCRGSWYEGDGEHGLAHLGEHCIFGGTEKRSKEEMYCEMEELGDTTNAYTSYDTVRAHGLFAKDDLARAAAMLGEMFVIPSMPDWYVDQEKHVVQQEIKQWDDKPTSRLFKEMYNKLIEGGMGHAVIGESEDVASFSRDTVYEHWRKGLTGDKVIFGVSASLEDGDIERIANAIPQLQIGTGEPDPRSQVKLGEYCEIEGDYEHVYLSLLGMAPPDEDRRSIHLFDFAINAIGCGTNSRFYLKLREEMRAAYSVSADFQSMRGIGVSWTYGAVDRNKWQDVIDVMRQEIADVVKNGLTEREIERIKQAVIRRVAMKMDQRSMVINDAITSCLAGNPLPDYMEERDMILAMKNSEIRDEVGRWLDADMACIVLK